MLQKETELQEVVQLLGVEALAPEQRVVLRSGRLLREAFLQQSSFDEHDASCPPVKSLAMLRVLHVAHDAMTVALRRGVAVGKVVSAPVLSALLTMKRWPAADVPELLAELVDRVRHEMEQL